MIKFEEHDGKLFRMLEKPVPLKENDANVLVRFITHGVIGEFMEHWLDCNQKNVPIYVEDVDSDGDVTVCIENGNGHIYCPFPMFEIIGTHVKEGSAEWALYRLMQGDIVMGQYRGDDVMVTSTSIGWHEVIRVDLYGKRHGIPITDSDFLFHAEKMGWQIYKEPKHEPRYKVGDYLEVDENGKIVHCYIVPKSEANQAISGLLYDLSTPKRWVSCIYRNKPNTHIIRKLKPSEIVVKIGCLSGTVESVSTNGTHIWFHLIGVDDKTIATIRISCLDTPTAELVRELLKAQEEE